MLTFSAALASAALLSGGAAAASNARAERAQSFYKTARSYVATYDYGSAIGNIRQAQTFDPSSEEIRAFAERLDRIVKTFPDRIDSDASSHVFLEGVSKYVNADYGTALLCLGSALGNWPLDETLRRFIKDVEKESGRKLDPEDVRPTQELTALKLEKAAEDFNEGRLTQALIRCRDAVALDPGNVLAYTRIGSIEYAMGDKVKAREAWIQALALNPDDKELQDYIRKLDQESPRPSEERQ